MKVLGIETSCDETAAAVVESNGRRGLKLLSNVVASSMDMHKVYGGIVPEIAARSHIESINPVIKQALAEAGCGWPDVDGIAVTHGPGLGGSLLVGVLSARTLAIIHKKPLYAINHVQAHVYASFITSASDKLAKDYKFQNEVPAFPLLALVVSGGHTQLVLFESHFDYRVLGKTADDAVGEAFDKVAKMLGLPYPGGPSVEKLAKKGGSRKFVFPKARSRSQGMHTDATQGLGRYDFSYSGLKTAVLRAAQQAIGENHNFPSHKLARKLTEKQKADIAAEFSRVAMETLVDKTMLAYEEFLPKSVVVAGGVSASPELRRQINGRLPIDAFFPDAKLCTDNGAMIAALGYYQGKYSSPTDAKKLDIQPNLSM